MAPWSPNGPISHSIGQERSEDKNGGVMRDKPATEAVTSHFFASRHEQAVQWNHGADGAYSGTDAWERWLQDRQIDPASALQLCISSANRALTAMQEGHRDTSRLLSERLLLAQMVDSKG